MQTKNTTLYYSPNHVANSAPDTMFCSALPPGDCSRARVLLVFVCLSWCVLYFLCPVSCVPNEASFQTKNRTLYHFSNHVANNAPDIEGVSIWSLSKILIFDSRTVPTGWHFRLFILSLINKDYLDHYIIWWLEILFCAKEGVLEIDFKLKMNFEGLLNRFKD